MNDIPKHGGESTGNPAGSEGQKFDADNFFKDIREETEPQRTRTVLPPEEDADADIRQLYDELEANVATGREKKEQNLPYSMNFAFDLVDNDDGARGWEIKPTKESDQEMLRHLNILSYDYFSDSENVSNQAKIKPNGIIYVPVQEGEKTAKNIFKKLNADEICNEIEALWRERNTLKATLQKELRFKGSASKHEMTAVQLRDVKQEKRSKKAVEKTKSRIDQLLDERRGIAQQAIILGKSLGLQSAKPISQLGMETVVKIFIDNF